MAILEVKGIRKSFGKLNVLKDISLSVEDGEIVSIIGSSGSGKSTLLRCINQLETVEEDIANSRKYYNGAVKRYNMSVQTVPSNIIAGIFHFETKPMFEVENVAERQNVQVKF